MFRKIYVWLIASPPRTLAIGFAFIIALGSFLLHLSAASRDGEPTRYIDALFTATSATCVTGLVVVDTGEHYSTFGQIVILTMIQMGGLGFMSMATLFAFFLKRRISLKERLILQESLNQSSIEGIVRLVRRVVLYALTIEAVGAALFSLRFLRDMSPGKAIYYGIFHSVSFFNNAGFDIMGDFRSLTGYVNDPLVNLVTMALIVLGGLGFVVLSDLTDLRSGRRLSLHSKVVLTMSGSLILFGAIVIFAFEYSNPGTLKPLDTGTKILSAFMQSVSPRTAGVNTVDLPALRQATQFFIVLLMFIGASPGSTGGGIKTTTFAALLGAVWAIIRGREDVVMFRYRLAQERVYKALTLTLLAVALVLTATMILSTTEDHYFLMILFEVVSAFGTVGLSMGLTSDLTLFGKIVIMLMMFAGRLGPLTIGYALVPKRDRVLYREAEGKIIIG